MPKSKSETTPEEQANYLTTGLNLDKVLGDSIALLNARKVLYADAEETRLITAQVGQLEAEQTKAYAEILAFLAKGLTINPPGPTQVADMEARSKSLDGMIASSTTTTAILTLTAAALADWQKTHP